MFDSRQLDLLTLTEPLACVRHGQDKIPAYLNVLNAIVYGGGPIGALHLIEIGLRFPRAHRYVVEPNAERRARLRSIFPSVTAVSRAPVELRPELSIVATSDGSASIDAIAQAAASGFVLLFSGINHRDRSDLPTWEGMELEKIHRSEEIRVDSRGVRIAGSSGYHISDIDSASRALLAERADYAKVQSAAVDGIDSKSLSGEIFTQPLIEIMMNDESRYMGELKVLFRMGDETRSWALTPDSALSRAVLSPREPADVIAPGSLRLKMLRASICQTDRRVLAGTKSARKTASLILGHEGLGEIEAVGEGVSRDWIGKVAVVLPHHYLSDAAVDRGLGFLSPHLEHLGIHRDGLFATRVDLASGCVYVLDSMILKRKAA